MTKEHTVEQQELDIVEFTDEFSIEWLNDKLRQQQVFGGVKQHLIPTKTEDFLLPRILEQSIEDYLRYVYETKTGGVEPISSQETYTVIHRNNKEYLQGEFKAMYVPAERSEGHDMAYVSKGPNNGRNIVSGDHNTVFSDYNAVTTG